MHRHHARSTRGRRSVAPASQLHRVPVLPRVPAIAQAVVGNGDFGDAHQLLDALPARYCHLVYDASGHGKLVLQPAGGFDGMMATTLQCPRNAFPIPPVDLAWFNDVSATALVHPWVLFKIRRKFSPQQQ